MKAQSGSCKLKLKNICCSNKKSLSGDIMKNHHLQVINLRDNHEFKDSNIMHASVTAISCMTSILLYLLLSFSQDF